MMTGLEDKISKIENEVEKALWELELQNELAKALQAYQEAETSLEALNIKATSPAYGQQQRVLSYCLMRQGNILRQMGKAYEALELSEREITAARASNDEITLARSLMSNGTNKIVAGEIDGGLKLVEESHALLEKGDSYDYKQMLGWYWILQADLANAGLVHKEPAEVIDFASRGMEILKPIENWTGVARCYAARAKAYDKLGDIEKAKQDRQEQKIYEERTKPE